MSCLVDLWVNVACDHLNNFSIFKQPIHQPNHHFQFIKVWVATWLRHCRNNILLLDIDSDKVSESEMITYLCFATKENKVGIIIILHICKCIYAGIYLINVSKYAKKCTYIFICMRLCHYKRSIVYEHIYIYIYIYIYTHTYSQNTMVEWAKSSMNFNSAQKI